MKKFIPFFYFKESMKKNKDAIYSTGERICDARNDAMKF